MSGLIAFRNVELGILITAERKPNLGIVNGKNFRKIRTGGDILPENDIFTDNPAAVGGGNAGSG